VNAGTTGNLAGLRVLISAGGTREPLDPVRFLGNRSSGRQGVALAAAAHERGASVTLLAAHLEVPVPEGITVVPVQTAAELAEAARANAPESDLVIMAAAVADYRPAESLATKRPKDRSGWTLELEPTTDVLASLSEARRPGQVLVGFAAEHGDVAVPNARGKLERKKLDAVVVNDISKSGIGFDTPENEVTIVMRDGDRQVPRASKAEVAAAILDAIEDLRAGRHTEEDREFAKGDG
jgi:phosphopantothenoylcysteine decarboxylase/phosphopantothenate--cysteine ligase